MLYLLKSDITFKNTDVIVHLFHLHLSFVSVSLTYQVRIATFQKSVKKVDQQVNIDTYLLELCNTDPNDNYMYL